MEDPIVKKIDAADLVAPNGKKIIGTLENLYARSDISAVEKGKDSKMLPIYSGNTEMFWDGQMPERDQEGRIVYLCEEGEEWTIDQDVDGSIRIEPAVMSKWKPFSTAPKDGSAFLVFLPNNPKGHRQKTAAFVDGVLCIDTRSDFDQTVGEPSHWTPLQEDPVPPTKNVRIELSGYVRMEYSEVIKVPADMSDEDIRALAEQRYRQVDGGLYTLDPEAWNKGDARFEHQDGSVKPNREVLKVARNACGDFEIAYLDQA